MMKRSWIGRMVAMAPVVCVLAVACGDEAPGGAPFGSTGDDGGGGGEFIDPNTFGDGGAGNGDGGACAALTKKATVTQLDLVLLVDSSASMKANDKWKSLVNALQSFFADPRAQGIGVGLQYFPHFAGALPICDESDYAKPIIDVAPLEPTHAGILVDSLAARIPFQGTPMGPALQGALQFATTWQKQNADRKVVTVLATDGLPDTLCQFGPETRATNTLAGVQAEAAKAVASTPTVPTYVIGVGTELGALNAVAASGGTGEAVLIDVQKDVTAQLIAALDKIRRTELTCEYGIPVPDGNTPVDLEKVNVKFTDELGYVDFLYVESAANCNKTDYGWYFDQPTNPKRIVLCNPFCDEVKTSRLGRVDILLGCKRQEAKIK